MSYIDEVNNRMQLRNGVFWTVPYIQMFTNASKFRQSSFA